MVVPAFDETPTERRVLDDWISRARPAGSQIDVLPAPDHAQLARVLIARKDDPWVLPVGVGWLPSERDGARVSRVSDLLALTNPRHPKARKQDRILRDEPDRCRLVVGEPARLSDLRRRFLQSGHGAEGFEAFVRRQAVLALARAERALQGTAYKVPRLVSQDIRASRRFSTGVARLAQELRRPEIEVSREASRYIEEMVASHSRVAIDLWAQFGRFLSRAYTFSVDRGRLRELKKLNRRHALVFLPSHRSYLDPLVLRPALIQQGFPPNHIMGGINVAFWPIGPWAKRSGIVFIRRSIRENPVYKFALREYMGYLVRKRFNLEWYIEGGRTRTGKLRPPRYGLLAYLVEAFEDCGVEDVYLVPVSIVYDQLYEVGVMAKEEHGAGKRRESFTWLVEYARAQGRGFGKVNVRFGDPLSLREALSAARPPAQHDGGGGDHAVERIAFEVSHRINRATPVTPISLLTLALLGGEDRALTLGEIRAVLNPLLDYVKRRDLPAMGELLLDEPEGVKRTLDALVRSGVATCFAGGLEPVWAISPDRHLEAAFYRNGAAHFFVNRAIAELVVARAAECTGPDVRMDAWREARRLRDLLKFEFFFPAKKEFGQELAAELALVDPDWERSSLSPDDVWAGLAEARPHLAHRVLQSFLEAYAVVAERLAARDPSAPVDEKEFLRECLGVGRQWRMQGRLHSAESISKELFSNGWRLAANRGLLEPDGKDLAERRRAFAREIADVVARLERIRELAIAELSQDGGPPAL